MPAGAGTARYENGGLVAGIVSLSFLPPPATPLDSGFRRNDEVGGRNDERGGGGIQALSRPGNIIFVPITKWAAGSDEGWRDGRVRSPGWERVPALHVFLSTAGSQC